MRTVVRRMRLRLAGLLLRLALFVMPKSGEQKALATAFGEFNKVLLRASKKSC